MKSCPPMVVLLLVAMTLEVEAVATAVKMKKEKHWSHNLQVHLTEIGKSRNRFFPILF